VYFSDSYSMLGIVVISPWISSDLFLIMEWRDYIVHAVHYILHPFLKSSWRAFPLNPHSKLSCHWSIQKCEVHMFTWSISSNELLHRQHLSAGASISIISSFCSSLRCMLKGHKICLSPKLSMNRDIVECMQNVSTLYRNNNWILTIFYHFNGMTSL
jgi:hypothetical protein